MNILKFKSRFPGKIIMAIISLLFGVILAVGYPAGGVKAHKHSAATKPVHNSVIENKTNMHSVVVKEIPKKHRVETVLLLQGNEDSQEEGC